MFTRIETNPAILCGKPCIRGTRISVEFVLELIASGASFNDIVKAYPHLSVEDIAEAVRYAAYSLKNDVLIETEIAA